MRFLIVLSAMTVALGLHAASASAAGDARAGKALAERWCASCHLVAPEQTSATTEAPPFASVAERSAEEIGALAAFLADPHPPMPQMSLTRQEIQDLLAYIASLK
ncbi:MAG: c-type cytochrome [Propylenella sp.]